MNADHLELCASEGGQGVLREVFVASDSVANAELAALHVDEIYSPVDPATIEGPFLRAGFAAADVRSTELGWAAHASTPAA